MILLINGIPPSHKEEEALPLQIYGEKRYLCLLFKKSLLLTPMRKLTIEEMGRMDVATFREADKLAVVVVLDNVRSLHNVGAVFRTADAFALHGLCLCGITATPPSAEIHKTALGAEDTVAWTYHADTLEAVIALKREGYKLLAVEQVEGSTSLSDLTLSPNDKVDLVMGNEVKGVRQEVIDICDGAIEIPQYGTKHSLNVSVSAGIVMWEVQKALRQGKD